MAKFSHVAGGFAAFVFALTFVSRAASTGVSCDAWPVTGSDAFGDYHGQLQIRSDGNAAQVLRYETPLQNGLTLEALWLGKRESESSARFELKRHRFLSQFGNESFGAEAFAATDVARIQAMGDRLDTCLPITDELERREERKIGDEKSSPFLVKLVEKTILAGIIDRYRQIPEVAPYQNHPEFEKHEHFLVRDFTDREFYRRNKNVLRVRNQVLSPAALAEAKLRRAAFVRTIDEKAHTFDQNVAEQNLNSVGIISLRTRDAWTPDGDAALWTGMYVASQFARYRVTSEPQALENAERGLEGIFLLLEITGDPTTFARSAMKSTPGVLNPGWKPGPGKYQDILYLPGGNNDMFHGIAGALISGYRTLPENLPLRARVLNAMRKLSSIKLREGSHPNPVYVFGMKALADQDADAYQAFLKGYLSNEHIQTILGVGHGFYVDGIADWSGVNLSSFGVYCELMLAHELTKIFPRTGIQTFIPESGEPAPSGVTAEWIESELKKNLKLSDETYRSSGRDFVCLLAYAVNRSTMGNAPNECREMLEEVPFIVPEEKLAFNSRLRTDWVPSAFPAVPWKFVGNPHESYQERLQGNRIYPIFET